MPVRLHRLLISIMLALSAVFAWGCSEASPAPTDQAAMYRAKCPYCGWDGYWPLQGLRENNGRALCSKSCGQVFQVWGTPNTIPETLDFFLSQCPYCSWQGYWPMQRLRESNGRAVCDKSCGKVFQAWMPPTLIPQASTEQTTVVQTPLVAENGSYFGQPNAYGIPKTVSVRGYYRRDGTYVRGHYRSAPRR